MALDRIYERLHSTCYPLGNQTRLDVSFRSFDSTLVLQP